MDHSNPADAVIYWWTQEKKGKINDLVRMLGVSRATYEGWRVQGRIPDKYLPSLEEMGFEVDPIDNQDYKFASHGDEMMTLAEIGGELGVSRERVRQLTTNALKSFAKELARRNIKKEDLF